MSVYQIPTDAVRRAASLCCAVTCHRCGMRWNQDPALAVPCQQCHAEAGEPCWENGRLRHTPHLARDYAALRTGSMPPCEALTWDGRHVRSAAIAA